uniref:COP9 signalosome complex subunit 1 n=1 Tax=Ascaris suum TaxID=6253 RepID=F1KXA4_ASCSU
MSVPDPDELMDANIEEPLEEHEYDINNANEIDDEFGHSNASPLPITSHDENMPTERLPSPQLVNSSPLDLEQLAANYKGYALMNRLLFVADSCPPMRKEALLMLINYVVENTVNVPMYMAAFNRLDALKATTGAASQEGQANGPTAGQSGLPQCDSQWIETTNAKAQARLEMLSADFKRQKDEGVKESTRRAMDDLFQQQIQMGHIQDAVKLYGRGMREYCTSTKHVIQMLLNWIEVTIHLSQWHRVEPLMTQVERAINEAVESESVAVSSTTRVGRYAMNASQTASKNMKELIETSKAKIAAVIALYGLNSKNFKAVAEKCLQIDLDYFNYPSLLCAKDIAIFGTFCALATFERSELKEKVLASALFRKFLESEPKLVELLQKFCRSEFGTCLDIMEEVRDHLLLNMYLSPHVKEIYHLIRRRAIVQYFTPYAVADISHMAEVFRVSVQEMEDELVELIENDGISARIDSYNKIIRAKNRDQRAATYTEVLNVGESLNERVNAVILRATVHEAQICIGHLDTGSRGRRRPAQGHTMVDEIGGIADGSGCSSSSGSQTQGGARGVFSRLFGSGRTGGATSGASQAAEPDSSNEVPVAKSLTPEPPSIPGSASVEETVSVQEAGSDVHVEKGSSTEEQHPPPVPGLVNRESSPNTERHIADE